jgi:spermidine synthase
MLRLNNDSLNNEKVKIITQDAFKYITDTDNKYDYIIADFPDPRDVALSKLYTKEFYISIY